MSDSEPSDPTAVDTEGAPQPATGAASVTGSGAVAQGQGARAAGERGVVADTVIGSTIVTGDVVHQYAAETQYATRGLDNPFLGLRAFTYNDRGKFAGRDRLIRATVARMTEPGAQRSLVFVTGASGSGKSSFAQAGVLPELERHYQDAGLRPRWAVMRPGRYPLAALAEAVRALDLPIDPAFDAVRPFVVGVPAEAPPPDAVAVLVIDQFEELFTQSDPAQRAALVAILSALPPFAVLRAHIIATLRADYLPELFQRQALYDIAKAGVDLRAMSEDELKLAIERPIQQSHPAVRIEPALLERLARDTASDAAYLPLLQVTLEDLWRKGSLTLAQYHSLTDAIRARAEDVYRFEDFDAEQQAARPEDDRRAILDLLLDLVEVSLDDDPRRDVRQRRSETDLVRGSSQRAKLVDDLTAARLLSKTLEARPGDRQGEFDRIEVVDIIHESLITQWDRLRDAVKIGRAALQQRARFKNALRDWQADPRRLLSGFDLAEAEELDRRGDIETRGESPQQFLKLSIAARDEERNRELERARQLAEVRRKSLNRTRAFLAVVAILGVGLAAAGYAGFSFFRQLSATTLTQFLVAQSSKLLSRNTDTALLLGVEAARRTLASGTDREASVEDLGFLLEVNQCCSDQSLGVLRGHEDRVWSLAFDPVHKTRLASSGDDGRVLIWDVSRRSRVATLTDTASSASVYSVAFSPDGRVLLSGNGDGFLVARDTADWRPIGAPVKAHDSNVHSIAFSPDGRRFVTGGADGRVVVWDTATLTRVNEAKLHSNWIWSVAFTPDGASVASAGRDRLVWLWDFDPASATRAMSLTNHATTVTSLAVNRDSAAPRMVSGDAGGNAVVWDLGPWQRDRSRPLGSGRILLDGWTIWGLAMSPDNGTFVSGAENGRVQRWAMPDPARPVTATRTLERRSLAIASNPIGIFRIALSPDGAMVAAAGMDSRVSLWSMVEPTSILRLPGAGEGLAPGSAGRIRAAGLMPGSATPYVFERTWRANNAAADNSTALTATQATLVVVGRDGELAATAHADRVARVWNVNTGRLMATLGNEHAASITALAISSPPAPAQRPLVPTGGPIASASPPANRPLYAATGDASGRLVLWNAESAAKVAEWAWESGSAIRELAFSPDGTWLVAGGCATLIRTDSGTSCGRGEARAWRVSAPSAAPVRVLGKSGNVASLEVGPDNDTIAIGSDDWSVGVWRLSEPDKPRFTLTGHANAVSAVAFSPDGRLLASGDRGRSVIIWSLTTGTQIGNAFVDHDNDVTALAFSPDRRYLFSTGADQTVIRHDIAVNALIPRACVLAGRSLDKDEWEQYLGGEPYRATCP